jgi:hypothetical protein
MIIIILSSSLPPPPLPSPPLPNSPIEKIEKKYKIKLYIQLCYKFLA